MQLATCWWQKSVRLTSLGMNFYFLTTCTYKLGDNLVIIFGWFEDWSWSPTPLQTMSVFPPFLEDLSLKMLTPALSVVPVTFIRFGLIMMTTLILILRTLSMPLIMMIKALVAMKLNIDNLGDSVIKTKKEQKNNFCFGNKLWKPKPKPKPWFNEIGFEDKDKFMFRW